MRITIIGIAYFLVLSASVAQQDGGEAFAHSTVLQDFYRSWEARPRSYPFENSFEWERVDDSDGPDFHERVTSTVYRDGQRRDSAEKRFNLSTPDANLTHDRRFVWDAERFFLDDKKNIVDPIFPNLMGISSDPERARRSFTSMIQIALFEGILLSDSEPIHKVLAAASQVSVREQREIVGDVSCVVIDAKSNGTTYQIWADPENGYLLRKATMERDSGTVVEVQVDSVIKVGDWFFPQTTTVAYDLFPSSEGSAGSIFDIITLRWSDIRLSPDFEAEQAFQPNPLDDTRVFMMENPDFKFVVQNGNIVPRLEPEFLEAIEQSLVTASAATADLQGSGEVSTATSPPASKDGEDPITGAIKEETSAGLPMLLALAAIAIVCTAIFLTLRKSKK